MSRHITKSDIASFRKRWALVKMAELSELRGTSYAQKVRQLSALLRSSTLRKWNQALSAEDRDVRERWRRIREYYRDNG